MPEADAYVERRQKMEKIIFPPLYCPFPAAINPHAEEAERHSLAWARRFGVIKPAAYRRYCASNFGRFMARTYPTAPRQDLLIASDWNVWLFIRDDQTDEGEMSRNPGELAEMDTRFLAVLEGDLPTGADRPLAHALADIRDRIRRKATPDQMRLFVNRVRGYFAAVVWETANRASGASPDLATYVRWREFSGAVYPMLSLIELCEGMTLLPVVREHTTVRRLEQMTSNIICWSNDLFSLEKELRLGDPHNLVLVLRDEHGLTLQAAVERASAMHDAEARAFLALESSLPSFGPAAAAALRRYVAGLGYWMRGNFDWSQTTGRYRLAEAA
jgi:Terpene synthase family 2, C-terminal metal binding